MEILEPYIEGILGLLFSGISSGLCLYTDNLPDTSVVPAAQSSLKQRGEVQELAQPACIDTLRHFNTS